MNGSSLNDFDRITWSSTQTTSLDSPLLHPAATPQMPLDYRHSCTGIVEATAKNFKHPPAPQHSAPATNTNSSAFTATAEAPIHMASSHAAPHHPFTDCMEFAHRVSRRKRWVPTAPGSAERRPGCSDGLGRSGTGAGSL